MSANQNLQSDNHNAATTDEVMRRFNDVFQLHDPSPLNELVAEDCVIERIPNQRRTARAMSDATPALLYGRESRRRRERISISRT